MRNTSRPPCSGWPDTCLTSACSWLEGEGVYLFLVFFRPNVKWATTTGSTMKNKFFVSCWLSENLETFFFSFPHQVGSNAGIVGMTKEHLGLALALNVPVFVVVTKIDMCPANILQGMSSGVPFITANNYISFLHASVPLILCVNVVFALNRDTEAAPEVTQVPRL